MNKAFKAIWSDARQSFVTTSEIQRSHGKRSKASVTLCLAAALLAGGSLASAAYVETGVVGDKASWETPEYLRDWGLTAHHASTAYSLGFHGQGLTVAVMDSGALLSHPDLTGSRFSDTHVTGQYGSDGNRYPQTVISAIYPGQEIIPATGQPFTQGETYDVTGNWMLGVNDGHGTHVTGTVGANRNGEGMHGVSWGSNILVGNTGATDSNNYGPFQDYDYFQKGWKAIVDKLVADNGADRGGVINNSWGTNIRIGVLQQYQASAPYYWQDESGRWHYAPNPSDPHLGWVAVNSRLTVSEAQEAMKGSNSGTAAAPEVGDYRISFTGHIPTNDVAQAEYEFFYHNKTYGGMDKSFVDAAWDAVKGTKVVQIFTTGNRDSNNPFYRPLFPYFNPEAEGQWIAVAGLTRTPGRNGAPDTYSLYDTFNEAGLGKWWTVAAPGDQIWSTTFDTETGLDPSWGGSSWSGTSMAAPHVAGSMGVLMSRYPSMDATQVREVLFTTANHKNPDGSNMTGWNNKDGTTPAEGEVSDAMGWGVPDLDKGMYGPGQLLGKFDYNLNATPLDVWTNDISEVALKQREKEDKAWMEATKNGTDLSGDYELGESFVVGDGDTDLTNHVISAEDAQKWRAAYYQRRAEAIQNKIDNDLYKGSLIKRGAGTLVMTGNNSYTGGTEVREGSLFGFSESFGTGDVNVNGGTFGLLSSYNDNFTQKGQLNSLVGVARAPMQKANVVVNNGGTYAIVADQDVQAGNLTFNPGSKVTVTSLTDNAFEKAYNGEDQVGTVTADNIEGFNENAVVTPDLALVDHTVTLDGNTLTGVLTKSDKTLADYAANSNGVAVANALMSNDVLMAGLTDATKDEARNTLNSLGNDIHVTANAMTIANGQSLVRAIKDQAIGIDGAARVADVVGGRARLWLSAVGNWSKMDRAGASKLKADFYTGLVGLEADINTNNKVGVFFGAGKTKFKGGHDGKIDSDDLHFGIYGQSKFEPVRLNYGFAYTHQNRDANSALFYKNQAFPASPSYNAKLAQIFGEVAYTGLNFGSVNVEPYVGLAWMHLSADDFSNDYVGGKVSTKFDSQNLAVSNLGARVKVPFEVGPAKFKAVADVNWTQYMGDTRGKSTLKFGNGASAKIKSKKLSAVAAVGLGLEAQLGKRASLGVSYYGAYGSKIKSNGVGATFKLAF